MTKAKTASERFWHSYVASFRCIICKRHGPGGGRVHVHHIAEGSGKRSHYCVVPLCKSHHEKFHGGTTTFLHVHKVPGLTEYGLLVLFLEDIAQRLQRDSTRSWNEL